MKCLVLLSKPVIDLCYYCITIFAVCIYIYIIFFFNFLFLVAIGFDLLNLCAC